MLLGGKRLSIVSLVSLACIIIGCGDKPTNTPPVSITLSPYSKDSLAVRKILDTNGLIQTPIGEPFVTNIMVINSVKKDTAKRIGELKLQGKNITIIPKDIGQLTELKILQLDNNAICSIPAEIGNCTALTQITASNNNLAGLPPEIGKLDSLVTLILSHNAITAVSTQLDSLHALEMLKLDFNALAVLPPISNLSNLKILWLNDNLITALDSTIIHLPIEFLTVGNNKLCTIPDDLKTWLNQADPGWNNTQVCN